MELGENFTAAVKKAYSFSSALAQAKHITLC
jgi:hypothetical protein